MLSGGAGERLGGTDKAGLLLDPDARTDTLLGRAVAAVTAAEEIVVVGDPATTSHPVRFTREEPPGSGPAAALLQGLDCFARRPRIVLALAVDMPLVGAGTVARLLEALADHGDTVDGALLEDHRRQPLCAVYRTEALLAAAPGPGARAGLSMHALITPLRLVGVPAHGDEAADVDTWDDLRRIRAAHLGPDGPS